MVDKTEKFLGVPLSEAAADAAEYAESQDGKDYKYAMLCFKQIYSGIEDEDEIDEIEEKFKDAMIFASTTMTRGQFEHLLDLVNACRESGWEYITGDKTGDHGLSRCGRVWEWVLNSRPKKGEAHSLSIAKEADGYSVNVFAFVDAPVNYHRVADARLSRADLISLLMAK